MNFCSIAMNADPQDILSAYRDDLPLSEPQLDGVLELLSNDLDARRRLDHERNFDLKIGAALACIQVPTYLESTILRRSESDLHHDQRHFNTSRRLS